MAAAFALFTCSAQAVTVLLGTGALDSEDPSFFRPDEGSPPTQLWEESVKYDVLPFTIATSGTWSITAVGADGEGGTLSDPFIVIYQGSFDPANPLTNVLAANDDTETLDSLVVLSLTSGTNYIAVITSFSNGQLGTYTLYQTDPPAPPGLPATHWFGQTDAKWSGNNWASDSSGTLTPFLPTSEDDITFGVEGASNQLNTELDEDFTIKSLTINSNTGIGSPGCGGQTLTVNNATTINSLLGINSGVTLQSLGDITVSGEGGTLAGNGIVNVASNQSIYMNGALTVGATNMEPGPAIFSINTSGTGAIVMGSNSTLNIDLWTGAGLGDSTGIVDSSDRLALGGKLDATEGGTLVVGNPTQMHGFAGGDKWTLVALNGETGSIAGTLAVNDQALGLTSTQVGNFNQSTGVYQVVDTKTGLEMANAQDQTLMSAMNGILGDLGGRLFNLRAGSGEEGSIGSSVDEGVVTGEGDGPEDAMARRVSRSSLWEVYTTVGYANISLSAINNQAGVNSQTWAPSVGIERHLTPRLAIGFAASLLNTQQSYTNGLGSLDMEGFGLTTYASYVHKALWLDALYSLGRFDLSSERNPSGFEQARGDTTAWTNAVQLNGGWNFRAQGGKLVHGPFAGVDYLHVAIDGYSETGGGLAALAYADRGVDSLISRVGWSVSREFMTDFARITPQIRVSYERQNISSNNGTSVNLINQSFSTTTNSERPGQDYLVAGAGMNFQFTPDFNMLLTYQGQFFRENLQAHYGSVRFSYKF